MSTTVSQSTTLYDSAFYAGQSDGSVRSARIIVPMLLAHVQPRSVVDVGCGIGTWLRAFQEAGVTDVDGYDGDYVDQATLMIDRSRFHPADLRGAWQLPRRYDLAVSLEVAEHLPRQDAEAFVRRLTNAAPMVLFSAAIPGQGGTGHLNEQWQDYWRALFRDEDFLPVDLIRPQIWGLDEVEFWYQANIILFCSRSFLAEHPDLVPLPETLTLNRVHPTLYDTTRAMDLMKAVRILLRPAKRAVKDRLGLQR
jgi:SAM-dependent methyltransferase